MACAGEFSLFHIIIIFPSLTIVQICKLDKFYFRQNSSPNHVLSRHCGRACFTSVFTAVRRARATASARALDRATMFLRILRDALVSGGRVLLQAKGLWLEQWLEQQSKCNKNRNNENNHFACLLHYLMRGLH